MPNNSKEANEAQLEAVRGAGVGAAKWGAGFAVLAGLGHVMSPLYRGLTIQFKVYIQMSGMILGGMLEADARLRRYEQAVRLRHMAARERAYRERLERELSDDDEPPLSKK